MAYMKKIRCVNLKWSYISIQGVIWESREKILLKLNENFKETSGT